jgi:hypothetical protein
VGWSGNTIQEAHGEAEHSVNRALLPPISSLPIGTGLFPAEYFRQESLVGPAVSAGFL